MRVLLIAGGWSDERAVSLSGARGIADALGALGHETVWFDPAGRLTELAAAARDADFAFLNLHGAPGEDGLIQAMLDRVGCPYQGSGPAGSFLALHKAAAKALFENAGLRTPAWEFLTAPPPLEWEPAVGYPLYVKPNLGGSSVGMGRAEDRARLEATMTVAFRHGHEVLVEEALRGEEVTVSVLGGEALPPILIRPKRCDFFDYASKYEQGGAEELCPAPIPDELTAETGRMALEAHRVLGLEGYSRSDFLVVDGVPYLLEVNTLPGMTPTSLLPQSAAAAGMDFPALVARLIELGMQDRG
ncbi:D-alanine--D-alanine ligase [Oceanidesulfovibrio marinus]|uniref:D-alanine--D-alanine ligase n=1 Tax=Oceanidesulfovibrio marinus TaxID=370038 RepID=A0A6P1ZBZ4_9BACT|nr:D-alanine--D-alanine ligase [Oceanidesulfovibrio marinus]TVM31597.1 D-alanine--D-alanine ligase [Oceanidesulfovibrio marinus]